MILRSIEVSGWRCFVEAVRLGPFSEGLNVLFAPNGAGKSTLFESLRRGLLDGHRVSGRDVDFLRPWGRALSPKVIVEFRQGDDEFRVQKQFLDGASSVLERKEDGRFRPVAEGHQADEQVRSILTKNPPGRGLSQPRNWGLAQVLWAPQGNITLEELSDDLVSDIRTMLGAQVAGADSGPIEAKIDGLYSKFFTPGGRLRSGQDAPSIVGLTKRLEKAKENLGQARELQLSFEDASHHVEKLRSVRAQSRLDAEELSKKLKEIRVQSEEYRSLSSELGQREDRVKAADAQYSELKQRIDLVNQTKREVEDARELVALLEEQLPLTFREHQEREKQMSAGRAALENARKERQRVESAEARAEAAWDFMRHREEKKRLTGTISKIERAQKALSKKQKKRGQLLAPEAKDLRTIRKLIKKRDEAKLMVEASLITLEVVPEKSGKIEVLAGEETGKKPVSAGRSTKIQGSPEVVVELPGVARFRAWGPAGSIEEHRTALARSLDELSRKTGPFRTDDLDQLDSLKEQAKELDGEIRGIERQLETLLEDREPEEFHQEQSALESAISKALKEYPEWGKKLPDADALKSETEELSAAYESKVQDCETAWEKAQEAFSAINSRKQTEEQQLAGLQKQLADSETRLTSLIRDGKKPEEREEELRRVLMEWDASKARFEEIREKLAEYDDDPNSVVERLERQIEAATKDAEKAAEDEKREEGKLEHISAQGPYSKLVSAEEEVVELEIKVARERLRVDAVSLLHDTSRMCREEAIASVSGPVELAATRTFHRIAGRRLGNIQIDGEFSPCSVTPESLQEAVMIANLSGGEAEQMYLATRLALAEVLAEEERQLVVLDDVLTATDSGRLARVMNVLEEAAQRLQVLILTCHPERYRGLGGAEFFDLEAISAEPDAGRRPQRSGPS